jgi:hypothetical protein
VNHDIFKRDITGFPTIRHIRGNHVKEYEDEDNIVKDRSLKSFISWLKKKKIEKRKDCRNKILMSMRGGKRKIVNKRTRKNGGKWSLKYKKSINCKKPKGFSQKQHCKYGRK